jgi:hypothetical protein
MNSRRKKTHAFTDSIRPTSETTALKFASSTDSRFRSEQFETLARLPFLIWELAGGRIQKVMIISRRLRLLMQTIVCCGPKEIGRWHFRQVF